LRAKIETSLGSIEVELFEKETPKTVNNFVELARSDFYVNLVFHRIVKGFVIQTGDPNTRNGLGDRSMWGTKGSDKTVPLEIVSTLRNNVGTLGMARSQDPNSGSSQFYINLANNNRLDDGYTVFGKVTEGMQVANAIGKLPVDGKDAPTSPRDALVRAISIG
jgi:dolichyl-diphosphooligosaccharide---protein glycosyltransferase